jgi:hypothetical protein
MVMTPRLSALVFGVGLVVFGGCNKPSEEDCRKAIENVMEIEGTQSMKREDLAGDVRRCRGGSKRETVQCAIQAKTKDDLRACGFGGPAPAAK